MARLNFLRKSTSCCLSLPSPLKKSIDVLDAMIGGDWDHCGGVLTSKGVGGGSGGCVGGSGMLGVDECVVLGRVHSVVLASVVVSSVSDEEALRFSLLLSDETRDVAIVALAPAGAKRLFTGGRVCQRARISVDYQ
jgi:hypothetical protein